MSKFLDRIIERAKSDKKTIVLAEGEDIRTIKAADMVLKQGIANIVILGNILFAVSDPDTFRIVNIFAASHLGLRAQNVDLQALPKSYVQWRISGDNITAIQQRRSIVYF